MILFVDLEHPRLAAADSQLWAWEMAWRMRVKYRLESLSTQDCWIIRYDRIDLARVQSLDPAAVIVSGCFSDYEHYDSRHLDDLSEIYREADRPVLGFCAGMQLMAAAFGGSLGPLGPLPSAALDPYASEDGFIPGYRPGMRQARGYLPVQIHGRHPLLSGIPAEALVYRSHRWEVKELPDSFEILGSTSDTHIQVIAHRHKMLFGTQFHPEMYDEEHPDGYMILENFFRWIDS